MRKSPGSWLDFLRKTVSSMSQFRIGFLLRGSSFRFGDSVVEVLPTYAAPATQVEKEGQADGFLYPPVVMRAVSGQPEPAAKRPAHLFQLPASHEIRLDGRATKQPDERQVAAFVMHFLGVLHGVWLQFEDCWFDRRVPVIPHQSFSLTPDEAGRVIRSALDTWLSWPPKERTRVTNALFMHCRSASYDWEWERFAVDYWVTDGIWRTAETLKLVNSSVGGHAKRINVLCKEFGVHEDANRVRAIVELRKGLMHEALWDEVQPGTARSAVTLEVPWNLRRLNLRLFLAILGVRADFTATPWWCGGTWAFGLKP